MCHMYNVTRAIACVRHLGHAQMSAKSKLGSLPPKGAAAGRRSGVNSRARDRQNYASQGQRIANGALWQKGRSSNKYQ